MRKLLVVDDDRDILKVLKANLEIHDFEVSTADCWKNAEEYLSINSFDLIILDVMLPDLDGITACSELRKNGIFIPIIMLTARDKVSDKVTGLECGADDYIVKPFETLELVARIKACLRRSSEKHIESIVIGDIDIDNQKRLVKVRNKEIELTPKEYELLLFFVAHRDDVISREEIRKNVWKDSSLYSWSRVIDVHIQHIRKKIEENASNPGYIVTVPGVGYKFEVPA